MLASPPSNGVGGSDTKVPSPEPRSTVRGFSASISPRWPRKSCKTAVRSSKASLFDKSECQDSTKTDGATEGNEDDGHQEGSEYAIEDETDDEVSDCSRLGYRQPIPLVHDRAPSQSLLALYLQQERQS
jgi:hypothetical protein